MVMMSVRIFKTILVRACPRRGATLPSATGPPAAAGPRHARPTWQHKALSAKERAPTPKLGEREVSKGALSGTACSVPGKGADLRGGKGFQHFRERFLFSCPPVWGFNCMEDVFSGDITSSLRGYFFVSPGILDQW